MTAFTRRTHIVRVSLDATPPKPGEKPSEYMDLEILDAVAFRIERNKEVILDMDQTKAVPFIVDETGGDHSKALRDATQRTHMKRIVNPDDKGQKLDIEVMDCVAYRDQRGEEWILDMQPGSDKDDGYFNISDGTGDSTATRRVHSEIVSSPFGKAKKDAGKDYVTVVRNDNIAFRKLRGEEVIISIPSSDDPNAENVDFPRALTFVSSPDGYDPADDSANAVEPPLLSTTDDQHNYVNPVDGADGFLTGDAKIAMGPFWWIRKVQSGIAYVLFHLVSKGAPPGITLRKGETTITPLYDQSANTGTTDVTWYVWMPATPNVQVIDSVHGGFIFVTYGSLSLEDSLAGRSVMGYGDIHYGNGADAPTYNPSNQFYSASGVPPSQHSFNPFFDTEADAQAYANFLNAWTAFAGTTPQFTVGAVTDQHNRFTRDVIIKVNGVPSSLFADVTLAADPNDPTSTGSIQAQIYSTDKSAPVPSDITPATINEAPFVFNSEGIGSGVSTTYTVNVTRDTDTTDTVPPANTVRLFIDVIPPRPPA